MVAHREGSGVAEWHEKEADVTVIASAEVTMIYAARSSTARRRGGRDPGPVIKGGKEVKLAAGDVLHIPARSRTRRLPPGTQVTYFVTKVVE